MRGINPLAFLCISLLVIALVMAVCNIPRPAGAGAEAPRRFQVLYHEQDVPGYNGYTQVVQDTKTGECYVWFVRAFMGGFAKADERACIR